MIATWRSVVPAAILAGALAGCSRSPADKLQGKWVGDRIDNMPADLSAKATGWVKGTIFEFAGKKLTVTIPAEQPRTGVFKVARADGQRLLLSVERPEGQGTDEMALSVVDSATLRWDVGGDREIVLVRAQ